jgi:hypothetical protein
MMMKLLTDKEAGEKFCPFSFATPVVPVTSVASGCGGGGAAFASRRAGPVRCLRGECMAWQVVTDRHEHVFVKDGKYVETPTPPDGDGWGEPVRAWIDGEAGWQFARAVLPAGFCARLGFNPQPDWQRE